MGFELIIVFFFVFLFFFVIVVFLFFFFFSSRRRHTRWPRDWSSDACSSDLIPEHWHRICSDIDPVAEDHDQILKTPRLVIDNKTLNIQRAEPGQDPKMDE